MFIVYVLHSPSHQKIYVGYTSNLEERMRSHNGLGYGWTRSFRPWQILFTEEYQTKAEAMKREKQLKTASGREFVWSKVLTKP